MTNKQKYKILLLLAGSAIFSTLIYKVGLSTIYQQLVILKWKVLLLCVPYFCVFLLDTLGWKYTLKDEKASLKDLFIIRLAGESVNLIVPSANFAGEPVKAYFLKRHNISMVDGMASVVISKTMMMLTQIIFVMVGVAFFLYKLNISSTRFISSIAIILLGIPVILFIAFIQKHGLFAFLLKLLRIMKIKIRYIEEREVKLRELDTTIYQYYVHNKKRTFYSFVWFFMGWLAGMIEVFLIFYLLKIPIDTVSVYVIESLSTVAKGITSFIPGSIGGQEGGIIAIFMSLKLSAGVALTFGILRRSRELAFIGTGLFVLSKLEWAIAEKPADIRQFSED